jgi:dissimilatory sulfite reductase related protein
MKPAPTSIDVAGKTLDTDENGYLIHWSDWSEDVARAMARTDNCELTPAHWEVIHFLRNYYDEYKIAPAVRVLVKAIGRMFGADKGNSKYLYNLFPYGPAKQACRYAGLPKPTGCI